MGESLALLAATAEHLLVEPPGAAAGHGQGLPGLRGEMLGQEDDLADVVAVVGELAVDGLDDAVRLGPDEDRHPQILLVEGRQGLEQAAPPLLPEVQEHLPGGAGGHLELGIAVAAGLFAVGMEEVGPPRAHVARHVLDEDRQAVGLGVEGREEVLVAHLGQGPVAEILERAELIDNVCQVERRRGFVHGKASKRKGGPGGPAGRKTGYHRSGGTFGRTAGPGNGPSVRPREEGASATGPGSGLLSGQTGQSPSTCSLAQSFLFCCEALHSRAETRSTAEPAQDRL